MNRKELGQLLLQNQTLSVYQLAILDYLNSATKASDISGIEPNEGPISDDPTVRGRGYDIGITVAKRVLDKREKLGGKFKSIEELADISYFGVDKMQDLIYTYMKLRSPIPTGLGPAFDEYIIALSKLEIAAYRNGFSSRQTASLIRKLFIDQQFSTAGQERIKVDWDKVVPASKNVDLPSFWAVSSSLMSAVDLIVKNSTVKIGSELINMHLLLPGLEAKYRPARIATGHTKVKLASNEDFTGYMIKLISTTHQQLAGTRISAKADFNINPEALQEVYNQEFTEAEYATVADIYSMDIDRELSLSWNLLNYYTNSDKPSKSRYTQLATALNLGEYKDGFLSNDNNRTRTQLVKQLINGSFFLLSENSQRSLVTRMANGKEDDASYRAFRISNAFVLDHFLDRILLLIGLEQNEPVVVSWNRLEARPRTDDFSRTLRAEVRDALWFISRQWQFGEFRAEDTGSALEMRVDMQSSQIEKYSLAGTQAQVYNVDVPMETIVEAEAEGPDLTARMEMGAYFEKLVMQKLVGTAQSTIDKVILDFRGEPKLHFVLPEPIEDFPEIYSNPNLVKHLKTIALGRMIDGEALYQSLVGGVNPRDFVVSVSSSVVKDKVAEAAEDFFDYYENLFVKPINNSVSAWNPQQLEHQFHAAVPADNTSYSVLSTNEYANGHLDWYSFDFETKPKRYNRTLVDSSVTRSKVQRKLISLLPTDLKYPGMPMPRWWQFEDFKLSIGGVKANTNELPKLLMAEFALIYSNDWMLIPFDVDVGSLCKVKSIIVKDVFGQYTSIAAAGAGVDDDWTRWSMYNLNRIDVSTGAADNRLFVPPAVVRTMEGEPLEEVGLMRDEMSNMVWGIEKTIPDDLGGSMNGTSAARRFYNFLESVTPVPDDSASDQVPNNAAIDYKLGTTVPENWIPFIPVRKGAVNSRQIQLRRAAMPRIIEGRDPERIRPRTDLLRMGYDEVMDKWEPYFLYEEEVPRSGVIVKRSWQRTRWHNGKTYTWLGRRVTNGRGEANSGLQYDLVENKE